MYSIHACIYGCEIHILLGLLHTNKYILLYLAILLQENLQNQQAYACNYKNIKKSSVQCKKREGANMHKENHNYLILLSHKTGHKSSISSIP